MGGRDEVAIVIGAVAELREEAAQARNLAATMRDAAAVRDLLAYADALENDIAPLEQTRLALTPDDYSDQVAADHVLRTLA